MVKLYVIFIHCYKYHGQIDTAKYAIDEETRKKEALRKYRIYELFFKKM